MTAVHVIHWQSERCTGQHLPEGSNEASVVRAITRGHVDGTITRVDCYDTAEDWARDVTEDIARAVANYYEANRDEAMSPAVRDFISDHAGTAWVRGLRIDDRSFAA